MLSHDWIVVDWVSSRCRAWAMSNDKAVDDVSSDEGVLDLTGNRFEAAPGIDVTQDPYFLHKFNICS